MQKCWTCVKSSTIYALCCVFLFFSRCVFVFFLCCCALSCALLHDFLSTLCCCCSLLPSLLGLTQILSAAARRKTLPKVLIWLRTFNVAQLAGWQQTAAGRFSLIVQFSVSCLFWAAAVAPYHQTPLLTFCCCCPRTCARIFGVKINTESLEWFVRAQCVWVRRVKLPWLINLFSYEKQTKAKTKTSAEGEQFKCLWYHITFWSFTHHLHRMKHANSLQMYLLRLWLIVV